MKSEHKQIPCKIFDAHCHIYPDAIAHKAVEGIEQFYDHLPFQPYDGTTGTLYRIGREAGISHYLVHSVATAPHQISSINRFIASEVALSNGAFTGLGTDRVMFGTDYPMWNAQPEIDCMLEMALNEDEYRRIFWDNAANIFGL